ncbi:MAG: hypothetical protein R8G66_24070 [Cytophagales bacterium]|nr:hypothetical protein [Cytophagales bacterium]
MYLTEEVVIGTVSEVSDSVNKDARYQRVCDLLNEIVVNPNLNSDSLSPIPEITILIERILQDTNDLKILLNLLLEEPRDYQYIKILLQKIGFDKVDFMENHNE